jgi:hypothetical protein
MSAELNVPAETQVLNALRDVLSAANLGAQGIHIMRGVDDAFEPAELPAVNLILVQEDIDTPSTIGGGLSVPLLQTHNLQLVVQVVAQSTTDALARARLISAKAQQAIGQNPTLGGVCKQLLRPEGKQWLHDDGAEQRLARQNTLYSGAYRTYSNNPFTLI